MKKVILLLLMCALIGCNNQQIETERPYEEFQSEFLQFKNNFKPQNFSLISPEVLTNVTTSFPKSKIDNRQADVVNENPVRYEVYYKSNETDLLVKVNFIYFPESKQKQFLTINSISSLNNTNIVDEYSNILRPFIDDYLLALDGYLVIINFVDTNTNPTENYNEELIASTLSFYRQFEETLLQ